MKYNTLSKIITLCNLYWFLMSIFTTFYCSNLLTYWLPTGRRNLSCYWLSPLIESIFLFFTNQIVLVLFYPAFYPYFFWSNCLSFFVWMIPNYSSSFIWIYAGFGLYLLDLKLIDFGRYNRYSVSFCSLYSSYTLNYASSSL